ncbi:atrial natriuretic peptide receptor 1-like isoform X2 [Mercenaria mercenaria]|uniref:atrial natriuretic peptide receptor 1-like isoform X2 n=1 Tax=Mercenaria mercenaria TaxID=6596 RepID=UPI00234F3829|nr:atrial natriuretic peptide receptor 1-like isoform X2 [Mercenaria mercenaria]
MTKLCQGRSFTMGVLVPCSGARSFGDELQVTMEFALKKVNSSPDLVYLRRENVTLDFTVADTKCDIGTGLFELVEISSSSDAFIGPGCDSLCKPAGLLAGKWNKPMISYSCSSRLLSDRKNYPTFARTTALYGEMSYFIIDIIKYYHWDRVVLVEGPESIWRETVGEYQQMFEKNGIITDIMSIPSDATHAILEKHLKHVTAQAKVFIICAYGLDVLYVLCAADSAKMLNGDHAFITIDFAYMTQTKPEGRPCNLNTILEGLLDVTVQLDEGYSGYQLFVRELVERIGGERGAEIGIHYGMIYDAVYLYALGMDAVIGKGGDPSDGKLVINQLLHHSFQGITGKIQIDTNGTRRTNFTLHNIFHDTYVTVAQGNTSIGGLTFVQDTVIYWPGGTAKAPLGRPVCGWDSEYCSETDDYIPVFAAVGMVVLMIVSVTSGMAIFLYKKRKYQERMESMSWKISYDDIDFKVGSYGGSIYGSRLHLGGLSSKKRENPPSPCMTQISQYSGTFLSRRSKSRETVNEAVRATSVDSNISSGQLFTKIASYRGKLLAIKYINKQYVAVSKPLIKEINEIRNLSHRNINPLVGACIDPMKICLLSIYCPKGSLQDVLENDNIKLDQIFKVSFASDIATGMNYLHSTIVKSHGHLKSSNVFIDQHWTCRVGDIGMPVFRQGEKPFSDPAIRDCYQLLWTAPEILRDSESTSRGTQKGDVYSYGIILQEIMLRTGPYGYHNMDPDDILSRITQKETPPFRPLVPAVESIPEIDDVMRMAWEEVPLFRPTFATILESLKKFNNGRTTNLVDQMVHMMEKYADHLEDLVHERTELLELEQKRTEDLLCRMLPRTIANDLKVGKIIAPESYDCVTVFFSDIVGFTALSSQSTAMEIVNFLNDLYTCFDTVIEDFDVYKVETIGDAYMVVSGLPVRNGNKHAGEIATMALNLLSSVTTFKIRHRPNQQLQMRIGIHSGPVCAGVVGLKMPRYCLFGDTVNYASRMESTGLALRIHVSPECKALLEELDGFHFECRGLVEMKGKGQIRTYFLLGRQGFSKPLPDLKLAVTAVKHELKLNPIVPNGIKNKL